MSKKMRAIRDLADIYYYQGYHAGRWEHENDMDASAEFYVEKMKEFADEWDIAYSPDPSEYIYDEGESECYTLDHMGYEIFDMVTKKLATIINE